VHGTLAAKSGRDSGQRRQNKTPPASKSAVGRLLAALPRCLIRRVELFAALREWHACAKSVSSKLLLQFLLSLQETRAKFWLSSSSGCLVLGESYLPFQATHRAGENKERMRVLHVESWNMQCQPAVFRRLLRIASVS
jgi:hypothetical protein